MSQVKVPKGFDKWSNEKQRAWVSGKLTETRNLEHALTRMLSMLVLGSPMPPMELDRPDLEQLKSEA